MLVVPSSVLRHVLAQIKPMLAPRARIAWASKGFELETGKLPHQVARPQHCLQDASGIRRVGAQIAIAQVGRRQERRAAGQVEDDVAL